MRKLFFGILFSLVGISANAHDSSNALLDYYMRVKAVVVGTGWAYLGCANSKTDCQTKAVAKGYEASRAYATCGPRNTTSYSCFAK